MLCCTNDLFIVSHDNTKYHGELVWICTPFSWKIWIKVNIVIWTDVLESRDLINLILIRKLNLLKPLVQEFAFWGKNCISNYVHTDDNVFALTIHSKKLTLTAQLLKGQCQKILDLGFFFIFTAQTTAIALLRVLFV